MDYTNLEYSWVGYYHYILNELFPEEISKYTEFAKFQECIFNLHMFIPFKDIVFIIDRPTKILLNEQGRLHSETEMSIQYEDEYGFYSLNGVTMPDWLITKPKNEIDPKEVLALTNAEQRMYSIKYLGLNKMLEHLDHKVLDTYNDYELIGIKLNERYCHFLKMINPSTGEIHLEGIINECKTVEESLMWRNNINEFIEPKIIT